MPGNDASSRSGARVAAGADGAADAASDRADAAKGAFEVRGDLPDAEGAFELVEELTVEDLEPAQGSRGTMVELSGDFPAGARCLFGAEAVAGSQTEGRLTCAAPERAEGVVAVAVTLNGVDAFSNALLFRYVAQPVVAGASPASGPAAAP